jgi:aldose 1-epimerase
MRYLTPVLPSERRARVRQYLSSNICAHLQMGSEQRFILLECDERLQTAMEGRLQECSPVTVVKQPFGTSNEGLPISRYTLSNGSIELRAITYGGIIQSLSVPGAEKRADVVLGFDTLTEYERQSPYFGAIIGRYANRLANAQFQLDGVVYQVSANEGRHHLHGGEHGFDKKVWEAAAIDHPNQVGVRFSRLSRAGESGYPGDVAVEVTYTLTTANRVTIDYVATTTAATVINLTQHTYFNLSGGEASTIGNHLLTIRAAAFTPVDSDLIPTGEIAPVAVTPFDFQVARAIGARIDTSHPQLIRGRGYDHNFVLDNRIGSLSAAATLHDPRSGRTLDIHTTEPGMQLYSGNRLAVMAGKGGRVYGPRAGVCLETQHFPDSPAHRNFPTTVLRPGHTFRSRTTWTFSIN